MQKTQYITTTLPYVNADPHVGFAMELIRADVIARHKKLLGYDIFFNTGTDEHGQKLLNDATAVGREVKEYVDEYAAKFRGLAEILGILSEVHFIRTTDPNHEAAAQEFWKRVSGNGYIYKKNYSVKYCVGCELEKTDSELVEGKCPIHPQLSVELIEEENYFFKFSAFQKPLLDLYAKNPSFVVPDFRQNEIKLFVERGLEDFSISRIKEKMPWGVPVPGDDSQVMYVWFDALVNYISTLGWPGDEANFQKFWVNGSPIQYCGKDNLRQQSAMWQAMLLAADLPGTHQIVINGFFTGDGGIKMSKSLGNVSNPYDVVREFGTDALRYFVTAEVSMFEDSPFTIERFRDAYNGSLANGVGNLAARLLTMAASYGASFDAAEKILGQSYEEVSLPLHDAFSRFELREAMGIIFSWVSEVDQSISKTEPFKLVKTDPEAAKKLLSEYLETLAKIAVCLKPFLPETAEKIIAAIREKKKPETALFERK